MMMTYLFFVLFPHQLKGDGPKRFKFEHFKNNKLKKPIWQIVLFKVYSERQAANTKNKECPTEKSKMKNKKTCGFHPKVHVLIKGRF
jgi:hypothetical protein